MKTIGIIQKVVNYPFVIQKSNRKYRLDILQPDTVQATSLMRGLNYTPKQVLYSVIYDGNTRPLHEYGQNFIFNSLKEELSDSQAYDLLIGLRILDGVYESFSLITIQAITDGGTSNRMSGLTYQKCNTETKLLSDNIKVYENFKGIKTLEYFKQTKPNLKLDEKDFQCLSTYSEIQNYVDSVNWKEIKYTAKDTETTGTTFFKGFDNDLIVGMSHSYKDKQGIYIPFRYKGKLLLDPKKVFDIMLPIYENTEQVFQNGSFDKRVFLSCGIEDRVDHELTILQHLINPQKTKPKALKPVSAILLDEDVIELDEILGDNFDAHLTEWIDLDLMTVYACGDTDKTLRVFKILKEKLKPLTWETYLNRVKDYNIVIMADWYGFPTNYDKLLNLKQVTINNKLKLESWILKYVQEQASIILLQDILTAHGKKITDISEDKITALMHTTEFRKMMEQKMYGCRSPVLELDYSADKSKIFYRLLRYPKLVYTDKGALSTGTPYYDELDTYHSDESTDIMLEDLVSDDGQQVLLSSDVVNHRVFPLGYMFKQLSHILNSIKVYTRLLEFTKDNVMFSPYKFNGTETARLTNHIQTIPKYLKDTIGFPEDSDYGFLCFDFKQIELRGVHNEAIRLWRNLGELPQVKNNPDHPYHRYQYQHIIDIFNSIERDPHAEMAATFKRTSVLEIDSVTRNRYKRVNFSSVYGAQAPTMAEEELAKAHTDAERKRIIEEFEGIRNTLLCGNLHLYNYFNTVRAQGLIPIPKEEIPYNVTSESVGRNYTRTGAVRIFELDNLTSSKMAHIQNQSQNLPIQGYCRDIYFLALRNLEERIRSFNFTYDDFRSVLFVHDEDGVVYNKHKFHPLWLLAQVYNCCCFEVKGSPIKYYCGPAIVCNWKEGKSDKYEVPIDMLRRLSTHLEDYEPLDTLNHRDYVFNKLVEYYHLRSLELVQEVTRNGRADLTDIQRDAHYTFFKQLSCYLTHRYKVCEIDWYNFLVTALLENYDAFKLNNITLSYKGEVIDMDSYYQQMKSQDLQTSEFADKQSSDIEFNDDDDSSLDLSDLLSEDIDHEDLFEFSEIDNYSSESESGIMSEEAIHQHTINRKAMKELNSKYVQVEREIDPLATLNNLMVKPFDYQVLLNCTLTSKGLLKTSSSRDIVNMLSELNTKDGYDLCLFDQSGVNKTGIRLPPTLNFKKLDKYIDSLRVKL